MKVNFWVDGSNYEVDTYVDVPADEYISEDGRRMSAVESATDFGSLARFATAHKRVPEIKEMSAIVADEGEG